MIKVIAETAWHHEGDFPFMEDLVTQICNDSAANIVKMHITLDLDEYMSKDHEAYTLLKSWMLSEEQWTTLIEIVRKSDKELMLLLNDTKAIEFAVQFAPEYVELHSVCLNVPELQRTVLKKIVPTTKIVIGVGGCSIQEIDAAIYAFRERSIILMFGFQNYPTKYDDINLDKVRKIQSLYIDKQFGYADHTGWDEENNELITLLVAANGMEYIEKHVTTEYGRERCDYSAAVSIKMFNSLSNKLNILEQIKGTGSIELNKGELSYSQYGPMKMAAVANKKIRQGSALKQEDFFFYRTKQKTKMSQTDVIASLGKEIIKDIHEGQVIDWGCFSG